MTVQQAERAKLFGPSDNLKAAFNRAPVLIEHALNDHPLLSLNAVAALAERLSSQPTPRGFFNLPAGQPAPGAWGSAAFRGALAAGFANIESSGMRLKLSSVHLEPGYRELLDECAAQLDLLTGGILLSEFPDAIATLFISSPGEITPYHVDSEINFLFQIAGTKAVHIYDGRDRSLIDTRDFERYWGLGLIEMPEGIVGQDFALRPGIGIHNPVHFPHWVQNGPMPSISLSVGFRSRRDLSEVFRVNHRLRRLGFSPAEPGSNPRLDDAKRAALRCVLSVKHFLKGGKTPLINLR
jgi:hypothetical protein